MLWKKKTCPCPSLLTSYVTDCPLLGFMFSHLLKKGIRVGDPKGSFQLQMFNSDGITRSPCRVLRSLCTSHCPPLLRSSGPSVCLKDAPDSTKMPHSGWASTAEDHVHGLFTHSLNPQLPCKEIEVVWFCSVQQASLGSKYQGQYNVDFKARVDLDQNTDSPTSSYVTFSK